MEGVVFSGGECLLSSSVVGLAHEVRELGYQIKVDTNGGCPKRLEELLERRLVDYVAMDYKAPLSRYAASLGWGKTELWERSFALLAQSTIAFELRTTAHPDLLSPSDLNRMFDYLEFNEFRGEIYLQAYQHTKTLGEIEEPKCRLEIDKLNLRRPFKIGFRNFSECELANLDRKETGESAP